MIIKINKKILITVSAAVIILGVYWFNTFSLKTTAAQIKSEKIGNSVRIVQLTDLHGSLFGLGNRRLLKHVDKQKPDIVFVTGDMYTSRFETGKETAIELMTSLAEKYPVYYVSGEHDMSETYHDKLREAGVNVLDYKEVKVTVGNTVLHLYGIDNVYFTDTFDLHNEFICDNENYSILLAHIPNFDKYCEFGADLSVCGDTHGGQLRLPFLGAVYSGYGWFPELSGIPMKGLYENGDCKMFISSGLGNYPVPLRLFNRPEIAVITLSPSEG